MQLDYFFDALRETYPEYKIQYSCLIDPYSLIPTYALIINGMTTKVKFIDFLDEDQKNAVIDNIIDELKRFDIYYKRK